MEDDVNNTTKKQIENKNDYSLGIVSLKVNSFDIVIKKDNANKQQYPRNVDQLDLGIKKNNPLIILILLIELKNWKKKQ